MSQSPVYIWDANAFENPTDYKPNDTEEASAIVNELINSSLSHGSNFKFPLVGNMLNNFVQSGQLSKGFNRFYQNIETDIDISAKRNNNLFICLDKADESQGEELELFRLICKELNLIMYDAMGFLFLPDGRIYPEEIARMVAESPSGLSISIPNTERFDYLEPEDLLRKVNEIKQQGGVIDMITIGENVIEAYEKNQWLENYKLIGYATQDGRRVRGQTATISSIGLSPMLNHDMQGIKIKLSETKGKSKLKPKSELKTKSKFKPISYFLIIIFVMMIIGIIRGAMG